MDSPKKEKENTLQKTFSYEIGFGFFGLVVALFITFGVTTVSLPVEAAQGTNTPRVASNVSGVSAQIDALQNTINQLEKRIKTLSGEKVAPAYTFKKDLHVGSFGVDVKKLQEVLNREEVTRLATVGPGSRGNETSYYGALTANAVSRFQEEYKSEILSPNGLLQGTGYLGISTRAKLNNLLGDEAVNQSKLLESLSGTSSDEEGLPPSPASPEQTPPQRK